MTYLIRARAELRKILAEYLLKETEESEEFKLLVKIVSELDEAI